MDLADLHDDEIKQLSVIWQDLMRRFSHLPNTRANLQELAKVANDEFIKAGFVVNVMWENNLIIDPRTMQPMPIVFEVLGRITGDAGHGELVDGHVLMDHERKRYEVLEANKRNEDFLGQKE